MRAAVALLLREAHVGQLRHQPSAAAGRRLAPEQDVGRLDVAVQLDALVAGGRVQVEGVIISGRQVVVWFWSGGGGGGTSTCQG